MMDWIGKTLGKVYIESLLARGGMAEVYLGTHTTLQRKVAVKLLRPYHTDDVHLHPRQRFEMEARAVAGLRHPNIVQVFDFDTIDDQPYLVMEYIPGPSLSKYLAALHKRNSRLGLPLVDRLLTRIADALQYAHESGVIHRDVKPGNILLTSRTIQIVPGETLPLDLEPVLTDFGLVRFLNSSRQTTSGLITGTPAYMSPEQAQGQAADGRTDIYSLGIILYEMLSGNVPFDGDTTMSILLKHLNESPPPIPGLSPPLQKVLDRALAKSPLDRFQQPDEFAAAFHNALMERSEATTVAVVPGAKSSKAKGASASKRQSNWTRVLLAGALLLILGIPLLFRGMFPAASETPSPTPESSDTPTTTPILGIPVTLGPTGMLHFQDGNAILDQAMLAAHAMPAPPAEFHYQVWLVNEEERLPLGVLQVDGSGRGELTYINPQGMNLLEAYSGVEVTIEPDGSSDANGTLQLAYAYSLPDTALTYLRGLMVSYPGTPEGTALVHGLTGHVKIIDAASREMLDDFQSGHEAGARETAESILNLLVGEQSPEYQDWNGDGETSDPGDGFGLLLNRNNLGYIQAVYSYADYALNSPGATRNLIVNGEYVAVCTQNLARWAPELQNNILTILNAGTLSSMESVIRRSVELADLMLNGLDLDEDGLVEPIAGECGVRLVYEYVYRMADMPLLPVAVDPLGAPVAVTGTFTPTATGGTSPFILTPTRRPGDPVNPGQPATSVPPTSAPATSAPATVAPPTDTPPGNSGSRPTQKPRPTTVPSEDTGPPDNPGQSENTRPTKKP